MKQFRLQRGFCGFIPVKETKLHLEAVIREIAQQIATTMLDPKDNAAVAALARELDRGLTPQIVPDRAYRISELEVFGFRRGRVYKAAGHGDLIIRKNGRASYVMGRDLLAFIDNAPVVGRSYRRANQALATARATPPRRNRPPPADRKATTG